MTGVEATPRRLWRFVLARFPLPVYAGYGVLWALAFEGAATTGPWLPSSGSAVRAGTVVATLLFLRMLDEQKDLAYDRVHNPDRPLVAGAVTGGELRAAMAVLALAAVGMNTVLSATAAALAAAPLAYGLFLAALERWSATVRDDLLVNLVVTYPVQIVIGVYLCCSLDGTGPLAALLALFAGVFLHFEIARKTAWHPGPGERSYSAVLGPRASTVLALAFAALATVFAAVVCGPRWWLPLPAVFAVAGGSLFLVRRKENWPVPCAMAFVLAMLGCLIVHALTR
ncbi:hypothetical protein [Amycolatopsis minnesotensis]|uniref:4-hydroxybenzoate polyprenyltransferase n=1 Tax=Amycolatopsis minnesotensis TaxID=337894 RepID=A0ABP5C3U1_9PSEU